MSVIDIRNLTVTYPQAGTSNRLVALWEVDLSVRDGEFVTVCWNGNSTQRSGKSYVYCGIEVFRVVDGKIVEIWNSRETSGHWHLPKTF